MAEYRNRKPTGVIAMVLWQKPALLAIAGVFMSVPLGSTPAAAHGGGLNAQGCHNQRSTGSYHCHRGDTAHLAEFTKSNSLKLAKDVDGNLVYLADTRVNLMLAQERWPKVAFHDTREHGQVMG